MVVQDLQRPIQYLVVVRNQQCHHVHFQQYQCELQRLEPSRHCLESHEVRQRAAIDLTYVQVHVRAHLHQSLTLSSFYLL